MPPSTALEAFTFGDPIPVLAGRDILGLTETWWTGQWYEPPLSLAGLAKSFRANPHHSSAIYVKRNRLVSAFIPHPMLCRKDFARWVLEFLTFGNAYLELQINALGAPRRLRPSPAQYTRRAEDDHYLYVPRPWDPHAFKAGHVHHLMEADFHQELYGVPEYLAALQAAWLNESATLFRRKYYANGSHAGFILYLTDPTQEEGDIDALREALKSAKGPGNFRNLFLYSPQGSKDGIKVILIAEVQAKDEFFNIKNVSRDDVLAGHRVPPQLLGIIPANAGGFGDVTKAAEVFQQHEIEPLMVRLTELNEWLGTEVVRFQPPSRAKTDTPPTPRLS